MPLSAVIGNSAKDTYPKKKTFKSFNDFVSQYCSNPLIVKEGTTKDQNPYFLLASYKEGHKTRNQESISKMHGVAIDIDDTKLSIKEISKLFKQWDHIAYTTFSHKKKGKGKRYRVVIPFQKPLTPKRYKKTFAYIKAIIDVIIDPKSETFGQVAFIAAAEPSRLKHFKSVRNKGKRFDYQEVADAEFEADDDTSSTNSFYNPKGQIESGERNNTITRFIGLKIQEGYTKSELWELALDYNINMTMEAGGPVASSELKTIFQSVFRKHHNNSDDWSPKQLKELIQESKEDLSTILMSVAKSRKANKIKGSDEDALFKALKKKTGHTIKRIREKYKAKLESAKVKADTIIDETHKEAIHELTEFDRAWVYVPARGRDFVFNTLNGTTMPEKSFNTFYSAHFPDTSNILKFLIRKDIIPRVHDIEYDIKQKTVYEKIDAGVEQTFVNMYIPPRVPSIKGQVKPLLEHFRLIIENKIERELILDWLAFLIQNPGEKILWMPVIKGGHGIGKSLILKYMLKPLLGGRNISEVKTDSVKSDFNAWALDCRLIFFHELKLGSNVKERQRLTESLKDLITEDTMKYHRKGIDEKNAVNCTNLFAITNNEDSILVENSERRFFMIRSDMGEQPQQYYSTLLKWCKANVSQMHYFFLNREMSKAFDQFRCIETDYTREMKMVSNMWPRSMLLTATQDEDHFFNTLKCATEAYIAQWVINNSNESDKVKAEQFKNEGSRSRTLTKALEELGFRRYRYSDTKTPKGQQYRLEIKKTKHTIWLMKGCEKEFNQKTPKQIRKLLRDLPSQTDFS